MCCTDQCWLLCLTIVPEYFMEAISSLGDPISHHLAKLSSSIFLPLTLLSFLFPVVTKLSSHWMSYESTGGHAALYKSFHIILTADLRIRLLCRLTYPRDQTDFTTACLSSALFKLRDLNSYDLLSWAKLFSKPFHYSLTSIRYHWNMYTLYKSVT